MIKDFKGRLYQLLETRKNNTLLKCALTGELIIIRNYHWADLGFVKP